MSLNFGLIGSEFKINVPSGSDRIVYLFEEFRLDKAQRMLYRGTQDIALPPKAIEVLIALIEERGEIVRKDDLMRTVWEDTIVEESNLSHHIHVLRKKLGQKSSGGPFIETFPRRGYRFTSDVSVIGEQYPLLNGNGYQKPEREQIVDAHTENETTVSDYLSESIAAPLADAHSPFRRLAVTAAVVVLLFLSAAVGYFLWQGIQERPVTAEVSVTLLTNGTAVLDATISPDGKYFAYHELDDDKVHLWVQQTEQSGRIEAIPAGERTIGYKTFSPNSNYLYFVGREKGELQDSLYRVPTIGGPQTKILTDITSPVSFSPDGSEMAFIRQVGKSIEFHLLVANADGSGERIILTRSGHQGLSSAGPAWSPDGKLIAFGDVDLSMRGGEGNCLITGIELQNGAVKALSSERWDNCYRSAWTPDGRGIVFIGTRTGESLTTRRDQIYYLSIADGKSRRLSTETHRYLGGSLGITADNSLLVVPHKVFSQIWTMSADGDVGTAVQLTSGQKDGFTGIAPLPDGRIGYITWTGENRSIWIMDPDGSNQRQINDQMPFVEALRATPDGRFFIFSARKHGFSHLYRIDTDGQNLKQLTDGESHEVGSTVSPDSSWVYHGSNAFDGQIWRTYVQRTSIDGGRTTTLKEIDASGLIPHVSPDGKSITCATHSGLKIYSTEDGSVQYSLETDKGAGWWTGAKWTPDGRSITYLVSRNKNINVWVQPIDGSSPPGPLTQFPKDHVYSHAFSSDGERLYVARGYQVSDAVLVRNSY